MVAKLAGTKYCSQCGEFISITEFSPKTSLCKYHQKIKQRSYRQKNPTKDKEYYEANKERCRKIDKKWVLDHFEYVQVKLATERTHDIDKELGVSLTTEQWLKVKAYFNHKCLACGMEEDYENRLSLDHIVPVSKGGSSHYTNLQPLCLLCNQQKNDKDTDYREFPDGLKAFITFIEG